MEHPLLVLYFLNLFATVMNFSKGFERITALAPLAAAACAATSDPKLSLPQQCATNPTFI